MRLALIGADIARSLSPAIHARLMRGMGASGGYALLPAPPGALPALAGRLRALDGFNVTMPHKRDILPLLDAIAPEAREAAAVNAVCVRGGRMTGYNTDIAGFMGMLEHHGLAAAGRACVVLGTGGAASACAVALRRLGAASVTFYSRAPARHPGARAYGTPFPAGCLLVNATPNGMPVPAAALAPCAGVADLIYRDTPLVRAARVAGIPAANGLYMLVKQAALSQALWQGKPCPEELTGAVYRAIKEETHEAARS